MSMVLAPEYHTHDEFQTRSKKLEEIRSLGIDPYPAEYRPTHRLQEILATYQNQEVGHSEQAEKGQSPHFVIAGRLVLFRPMGKNIFAQIQDENDRLQIMFNRDHTHVTGLQPTEELSPLKFLEKKLDLGDIIGIEGNLFRTQKGELTLYAKKVTVLSKTLLPLPDKHAGLEDKELRYRKRWLDLIAHPDVTAILKKRSLLLHLVRAYFQENQFMEVETPILQNVYGGAQAKPFVTSVNALDHVDVFLRISLEIPLKKLIVGGLQRVFEMGKVFRNEGMDKNHNPEFTMLEAYASYWDYNDMMLFMEKLFEKLSLALFGTTSFYHPHPQTGEPLLLDVKAPWKRMTMKEAIKTYAHIDVDTLSTEELSKLVEKELPKEAPRGLLIATLFGERVEEHLLQPHHIIDHPIETTPLCKPHRDPKQRSEGLVERFETYILTHEVCNAYSELNDPVLQRALLVDQAEKKAAGDEEANPLDEEFIEAICQGMPPTGGIGIGIDRLVMIFTGAISIRDILTFPMMKNQ